MPLSGSVRREAACRNGVCSHRECISVESARQPAARHFLTPQSRRPLSPWWPRCGRRPTLPCPGFPAKGCRLLTFPRRCGEIRPTPRGIRMQGCRRLSWADGSGAEAFVCSPGRCAGRQPADPPPVPKRAYAGVAFTRLSVDPPRRHVGARSAAGLPSSRRRPPALQTGARHSAARSTSCRRVTGRTGVPPR